MPSILPVSRFEQLHNPHNCRISFMRFFTLPSRPSHPFARRHPCITPTGENMKLAITLGVKFRSFGITFYEFDQSWSIPLPVVTTISATQLLSVSERGVTLNVGFGGVIYE